MDDENWTVQRKGRKKKSNKIPDHPRDQTWMKANCPQYVGSAADYDKEHYNRHGEAEGMVDGKHVTRDGRPDERPSFPKGSERLQAHESYKKSAKARNIAQDGYNEALARHTAEFAELPQEQQEYFKHVANELLPRQHEDLHSHAAQWDDKAYSYAIGRSNVLKTDPVAYHSLKSHEKHRECALSSFKDHEKAHTARAWHAAYRSDKKSDKRTDCWGELVSSGLKPHTRSRLHELPPTGTFSPYNRTPSPEKNLNSVRDREPKSVPIDWWDA